jgi:hypothetical protein
VSREYYGARAEALVAPVNTRQQRTLLSPVALVVEVLVLAKALFKQLLDPGTSNQGNNDGACWSQLDNNAGGGGGAGAGRCCRCFRLKRWRRRRRRVTSNSLQDQARNLMPGVVAVLVMDQLTGAGGSGGSAVQEDWIGDGNSGRHANTRDGGGPDSGGSTTEMALAAHGGSGKVVIRVARPYTAVAGFASIGNTATGTYTSGSANYSFVTFNASGSLTVNVAGFVDCLVIGGGGGGGEGNANYGAGGGGAGGYVRKMFTLPPDRTPSRSVRVERKRLAQETTPPRTATLRLLALSSGQAANAAGTVFPQAATRT